MQTGKLWQVIVTISITLALTVIAATQSVAGLQLPEQSDKSMIKDEASTKADRILNQHIRQVLGEDTALAAAAQSVVIVTDNGEVTLHGTVATEKEKANINAKVQQVAGVKKLRNQLQMSPPNLLGSANDIMSPFGSMNLSAKSS